MKRKRHFPEQIIRKPRTADQLLNQEQTVADMCRALEVSAAAYHLWQQLCGDMKAIEAWASSQPRELGSTSAFRPGRS